MGGRNRIVGGARLFPRGVVGRGRASLVAFTQGPAGEDGAAGDDGADGAPGEDGNRVAVAEEASFDPDDYNVGDVVFLVDDLESPTTVSFGGAKGDGGGEDFPDPIQLE